MSENAVQIQNLSTRHMALIDFMVANPLMRKGEIAAHFNVTPAWLSVVIHSDAFQAQLRARQDQAFAHLIAPLAEKLSYLAHQAVDRLSEKVITEETQALLEISRFATERINYEGKPMSQAVSAGASVHVHVTSAQILEEARARVIRGRQGVTLEQQSAAPHSPAPARLLSGGSD